MTTPGDVKFVIPEEVLKMPSYPIENQSDVDALVLRMAKEGRTSFVLMALGSKFAKARATLQLRKKEEGIIGQYKAADTELDALKNLFLILVAEHDWTKVAPKPSIAFYPPSSKERLKKQLDTVLKELSVGVPLPTIAKLDDAHLDAMLTTRDAGIQFRGNRVNLAELNKRFETHKTVLAEKNKETITTRFFTANEITIPEIFWHAHFSGTGKDLENDIDKIITTLGKMTIKALFHGLFAIICRLSQRKKELSTELDEIKAQIKAVEAKAADEFDTFFQGILTIAKQGTQPVDPSERMPEGYYGKDAVDRLTAFSDSCREGSSCCICGYMHTRNTECRRQSCRWKRRLTTSDSSLS